MLIKLLWLRLRGGIRQRLHEMKTLRGLLFLTLTLAIVFLMIKQSASPTGSIFFTDLEKRRALATQFMPISLLAAFLLTVFTSPQPTLSFNPSEINLLFSGPFTRRALLLYKVSFYAFGVFLSSLFIMLLMPRFSYNPASTFLGIFLSLLFIQLLTAATGLFCNCLGRFIDIRIQSRYVFIALFSALSVTGWHYSHSFQSLTGVVAQFQSSIIGTFLLAPFDVFVHIFLAQSVFPELLQWVLFGLTIDTLLLSVVILLDRYSAESSTTASLALYKRWDRAKRSGLPWRMSAEKVRSVMSPPSLGGIGPIAWRQMLAAFRNSNKALLLYLVIAIIAGPYLVMANKEASMLSLLGGVFFAAVFVLPRTLVFDFRSDLETIENFKALPLSAWKITVGQLAAVVILSSLIELVLLTSTAIFLDSKWDVLLIGIGFFLLPFNLLLYGLENLFFLLFPAPLVPVGRVDFDFFGRTLMEFAVVSAILISSCWLTVIAGHKLVEAIGLPWPFLLAVAWILFSLIALLTVFLSSWAFKRFDVGYLNN